VASALLLAIHKRGCQTVEGGYSLRSEFLKDTLNQLISGQWRLTGAQWVLYTDEISAALHECPIEPGTNTAAQSQRISKLIGPLLDVYPQVVIVSKDLTGGSLLAKKYFPELSAFIVVFHNLEQTLGYVVEAQTLVELAQTRLNELTAREDFRGALARIDQHGPETMTGGQVLQLTAFPPFQVAYTERPGSGGPLNFRQHFFLYSLTLLLLLAVMGMLFTYRAVSHEVEVTRVKSDFIAAVSHEFRSPLTSMSTLLERLDSGRVHDEEMLKRYHRVIRQELHRLSLLINDLLDFARLEEGRKQFSPEPSNLIELARETVNSFHNLGHADRVNLVQTEMPDPPVVSADPIAIAQCIQNLIDNAIKYSPTGTPVLVQTGRTNGELFLEVSDRGLGIPVSEQPKIFEQFYRARHTDVHNVKGAGLGLALVKRIMENHGGRVTVESRPGEGSKLRLVFPPARINHRDAEAQRN
jgi:signal transduction histidine kinase